MYYNQELGLCIEFGPVRVDSVRRGGGAPPPGSNPPCAGSRRHGLLPGLLVISPPPLSSQYTKCYDNFDQDIPFGNGIRATSITVVCKP